MAVYRCVNPAGAGHQPDDASWGATGRSVDKLAWRGHVTGQTDAQGGKGRQLFMTEQEKPVAIFLPQHRPGKMGRRPKTVAAVAMASVFFLGGALVFMMPRGDVGSAPVVVADADRDVTTRSVAPEIDAETDTVSAVAPVPSVQEASSVSRADAPVSPAVVAVPPVAKAARIVDVPRKDDPRWARAETRQGSPALEAVRKLIVEKAAQVEEGGSDLLAYAGNDRGMSAFAETGSTTRRPMQIVLPAELPEQVDDAARTASVNAPVNMRKGPGAKHGVMMVIPRQAKVGVIDCDQWCKISYEGRTGYIYKSFVRGRSS
jgi:hypothetical protein